MRICNNDECTNEIPLRVTIDGKKRNLQRRKFCLECSPFGRHNTSPTLGKPNYKCPCGETDPSKYYAYRTTLCRTCDNARSVKQTQEIRKRVIEYMGGQCGRCGYNRYIGALDIHHTNPPLKDKTFSSYRFWNWERIIKELIKSL